MQVAGGETAGSTCSINPTAHRRTAGPAPHRRRRRRLALLVAVAGASLTSALPVGAQTTSAEVLNTDQAASLTDAGVKQMVPRDGRLAGYGFEVTLTGVAFTDRAGPQSQPVQAVPGDELAVVSMTEVDQAYTTQTSILAYDSSTQPTFSMQVGQQTVSLSVPFGASNPVWAVAIPKGSPATFVATRGNFTQGFDLRRGTRTNPSPLALYRDPTKPFVTETLSATTQLTGTGSAADPVTVRVAPTSAELEYFKPDLDTLQPVPAPDQAWLVVDMDNGDTQNIPGDAAGHLVDFTGTIGGNSVLVQTPAGQIESVSIGQPASAGSLFPDYYAFPVPATFTTGTLLIKADGTIPAEEYNTGNPYDGTPVTLRFNQTPSIAIDLPPVPPAAAPGYLTSSTSTNKASGPRSAARTRNTSGSSPVWVVIFLALIVILGLTSVPVVRRRRTTLRVLPVGRIPRALLAGTTLALPPAAPYRSVDEPVALPPAGEDQSAAADLLVGQAPAQATPDESPAFAATAVADPAPQEVSLVLSVLGRFEAHGLRHPVGKPDVIRVLAALAIEDPPVTVEQLRDLCAVNVDKPQAAETIHSLISILRRSLPEGMLPKIRAGESGYRWAANVDVDWTVFRLLAGRAAAADGAGKVELGLKALGLVRGRPLEHRVWDGIRRHVARMETEIENLAADTARTALQLRDARSAESAIVKGMLALPESLVLWDSRFVAAAAGSGFGLERARSEARKVLGDDAEQLEPLYKRLKDGDW